MWSQLVAIRVDQKCQIIVFHQAFCQLYFDVFVLKKYVIVNPLFVIFSIFLCIFPLQSH